MTQQTDLDQTDADQTEPASAVATVKRLWKDNKKLIAGVGAGAVAAVVAVVVVAHRARGEESGEEREVTEDPETGESGASGQSGKCADGWSSPSIGKQGACSSHGGVASDE
ncbi:hypothetical protein ACFQ8C_16900 [Streptomyces sp. NPDC056503]|uniref:hypothetical protein n=1 Tax=Streptomyces sp. NPDC056503 TaxID=3345842 RepID=UPI003695F541